jgi:glyoxylase-like metal-dependent hydrolase (beta-lactamase superfamily II)
VGLTRWLIKLVLKHSERPVRHVSGSALAGDDVRHIVVTHLDQDHVGGLFGFQNALAHVTSADDSVQ